MRCKEKIEWKKQYNKYKALTTAAKCEACGNKAVRHAYHRVCIPCAQEAAACAMCREKKETTPMCAHGLCAPIGSARPRTLPQATEPGGAAAGAAPRGG